MIKKTLLAVALVAALVPFICQSAAAQDSNWRPIPSMDQNILVHGQPPVMLVKAPPQKPEAPVGCNGNVGCLFYGGDFDSSNSNADGFANGNTNLVPLTTVFVPFLVPGEHEWRVIGLFSNNLSTQGNVFDPKTATWSISKAPISSNGFATTVCEGSDNARITATGRSGFGFNEYNVSVQIPACKLQPGQYWMSVVPQCTNPNNSTCSVIQYFLDNTFGANAIGPAEPQFQEVFNSAFFGFAYANECTVSSLGCNSGSAAVIGTSQ